MIIIFLLCVPDSGWDRTTGQRDHRKCDYWPVSGLSRMCNARFWLKRIVLLASFAATRRHLCCPFFREAFCEFGRWVQFSCSWPRWSQQLGGCNRFSVCNFALGKVDEFRRRQGLGRLLWRRRSSGWHHVLRFLRFLHLFKIFFSNFLDPFVRLFSFLPGRFRGTRFFPRGTLLTKQLFDVKRCNQRDGQIQPKMSYLI